MSLIKRTTDAATLTAGTYSQVVSLSKIDKVAVTLIGDASTGTLHIQQRFGKNGTWRAYSPRGVAQTFTNATLSGATAVHEEVYEVGACELRFYLETAGTLTVYCSGDYVDPKPNSYS
jgi:hypothetical protein